MRIELLPPATPEQYQLFKRALHLLKPYKNHITAIHLPEMPFAKVRMRSSVLVPDVLTAGFKPVPHLTGRDLSQNGYCAELLGYELLRLDEVLLVSGDLPNKTSVSVEEGLILIQQYNLKPLITYSPDRHNQNIARITGQTHGVIAQSLTPPQRELFLSSVHTPIKSEVVLPTVSLEQSDPLINRLENLCPLIDLNHRLDLLKKAEIEPYLCLRYSLMDDIIALVF
jgi:hypothetical protein